MRAPSLPSLSSFRRRGILFTIAALALLSSAAPVLSQTPPTVTVIGQVVDAATRAPVSAARVALVGGAGVATNALGRFTLENVPLGSRRFVVTRLGYQDFEQVVQITDPMGGVQLAISPDPLQLEGVSTRGATEGTLRGRVIDADTGEPISWAPVTLTRDGVTEVSRRASRARSTDTGGDFEIPNLALGGYVLKVERPDYSPKLIQINHQVPSAPIQITLTKDYRRIAALEVLGAALDVRKNETGGPSVALGAEALQSTATAFMDQLPAPAGFTSDGLVGTSGWGLFIDGIKQQEMGILQTFSPKEFYRVDFIGCPGGGKYLLAYTYAYVEDRMQNPAKKDPMLQIPLCLPLD